MSCLYKTAAVVIAIVEIRADNYLIIAWMLVQNVKCNKAGDILSFVPIVLAAASNFDHEINILYGLPYISTLNVTLFSTASSTTCSLLYSTKKSTTGFMRIQQAYSNAMEVNGLC